MEISDCENKYFKFLNIIWVFVYLAIQMTLLLLIIPISTIIFFILILLGINILLGFFIWLGSLIGLLIYLVHNMSRVSEKTKNLIKNYPELNSNRDHHAIIIAHPGDKIIKIRNFKLLQYERTESYYSGEDVLIEKFQNPSKKINYKVYEINSKDEFISIISDEKITHLWIFGHGKRNALGLKNGNLCYFDVRNAPRKKFIGQYHCNSLFGKSLGDYNKPCNQDVTRFPRTDLFLLIRFSVKRKIRELESMNLL
jgi:hypothetical protein